MVIILFSLVVRSAWTPEVLQQRRDNRATKPIKLEYLAKLNYERSNKMKRSVLLTALISVLAAGCMVASMSQVNGGQKKKLLRVGVYDSRGIAVAYGNSEYMSKVLQKKKAALEQAKKEGNTEKVKEIEAWGPAHQAEAHLKAFGTAPVHDNLECVKDKIPQVAKAAGVDLIVSKWEMDYIAVDADLVDVTNQLAQLFNPNEKAWKSIEGIQKVKPYSNEELLRLEKEHPH